MDFIQKRKIFYALSGAMIGVSFLSLLILVLIGE